MMVASRKVLGVALLTALFVGLFICIAIIISLEAAAIIYSLTLFWVALVWIAVWLIVP